MPVTPGVSQPLNHRASDAESTPTGISSTGDDGIEGPRVKPRGPVKPEQVAGAVGALLGLALLGVDLTLRYTRRRKLRKPTKDQTREFAEPLGRILARHVDMSIFGPDLLDLAEVGNAAASYIDDGPITDRIMPAVVQVGMEQEPPDAPTERISYTETYGASKQTDEADWIGDNPHVTTLP